MFPFFLLAQVATPYNPSSNVEQVTTEVKNNEASILGEPIIMGGTSGQILVEIKKKRLVIRTRSGQSQEFLLTQAKIDQTQPEEPLEVIADQQEYDQKTQIIAAKGHVQVSFGEAVLRADSLRINLVDNLAVAEGNVILTRGKQILRGKKFEYYFAQDRGVIFKANGEIYQPSTSRDFKATLPTDPNYRPYLGQNLNDTLSLYQPIQNITTGPGFQFGSGGTPYVEQQSETGNRSGANGGAVNRVRYDAERIDFDGQDWTAQKIRLTNDPFSPPELEIQADKAKFHNLSPLVDEILLSNSVVVFDQTNPVPLLQNSLIIDREDRQPAYLSFGFNGEDKGGFYVQGNFDVINNNSVKFQLSPQYLLQKAISPSSFPQSNPTNSPSCVFCSSVFGLISALDVNFTDRTSLHGLADLSSLDLSQIGDYARAQVELRQLIGNLGSPYDLRFQYNYQQQLFNGTQGYQTVNSSYGLLLISPYIALGNSQIYLNFQASVQNISAPTNQPQLVPPSANGILSATRYQGVVSLNRTFSIWQGQTLPPTQEGGLKYTPVPVTPYVRLSLGVTGVDSIYSSGSSQPSLAGTVRVFGQFGNFSRPFLDYTGFDLSFTQAVRGQLSPFYFDEYIDTQTVSVGLTQQIYGPIRIGFQTSYALNVGKEISTDYFIEYSRRTYNLLIRYNPVLQLGSINLRISDFNWNGNPGPFDGTNVEPVIQGVTGVSR